MRPIAFALLLSFGLLNSDALAATRVAGELSIKVGDSIQEVKKSLEGTKVAFSQDSLAMVVAEPYLTFDIDPNQSFAVVSFNEEAKEVTKLMLAVHPSNQPQKSFRSWLRLRSLTLHENGDYTVRVAKDGIEAK
jgi:hypothetical protein